MKSFGCENCASRDQGIFCELSKHALEGISSGKLMNQYKKGQTLFLQGNQPQGLYCINSGKIKISKIGPEGKESIVRIAAPGDVLGHRSLFSDEAYAATATVLEDATVCFLEKKLIHNTLQMEPSVALKLIQKLSKAMGEAEDRGASMAQKTVKARMAELLLTLMKKHGVEDKGRTRLDIKLSREEMASMIGTANETVIRIMSDFKSDELIAQEGKVIYVLDEETLFAIAQDN
ncbi:Crp/Fnr family transcriptional regulator [Peredibacter starrii]|uniref:Crp/Fnr family transcriptional regulator n=1 Tax=Peredibacter starrii TaxID=28202 RepID=A0AAX4HPF5_9BACT|nr:Crp/Fnr family transcriptional regulator [Peredibacter starrii]WPU65072.1 Crp/Fnr family transcriptional regulator [Peredibacter starrii]